MPRNDIPAWADDIDSDEWQAILADPRWHALVRTMADEVASEVAEAAESEAAA